MKNSLMILVLLTCSTFSFAQDRQSAATVTFVDTSAAVTEAMGWDFFSGEWIGNKNQITSTKDATRINTHEKNFSWIKIATIVSKGVKYHVLYYQERTGNYKYPEIREDWIKYEKVTITYLDPTEYAKLKSTVSLKKGIDTKITFKKDLQPLELDNDVYDQAKLLDKISQTIQAPPSPLGSGSYFLINSQTLKGQDIVRFMLPSTPAAESLKEHYFEVPLADFKKLLID